MNSLKIRTDIKKALSEFYIYEFLVKTKSIELPDDDSVSCSRPNTNARAEQLISSFEESMKLDRLSQEISENIKTSVIGNKKASRYLAVVNGVTQILLGIIFSIISFAYSDLQDLSSIQMLSLIALVLCGGATLYTIFARGGD